MSLPSRTLEYILRICPPSGNVLDVGCNQGDLLATLRDHRPELALAGLDISAQDARHARERGFDARQGSADLLPWPDETFDVVTMLDAIEHFPKDIRRSALSEARRVLRPGGRLVLQTPHAGRYQALDAQNLRHRFPRLYRRFVGRGVRDSAYDEYQQVVWHHHFTVGELTELAGAGWSVEVVRFPGLIVWPLVDLAMWPFHRLDATDTLPARILRRVGEWDGNRDYDERRGYEVLLSMSRTI